MDNKTIDQLVELRMTIKKFERESQKCLKEEQKYIEKAKKALKKNDEEGSKLFISTALNKKVESQNLQRMAHKLDAVQSKIKSAQHQTEMVKMIAKIGVTLEQQQKDHNIDQLYEDISKFDIAMEKLQVNDKIINEITNQAFQNDYSLNNVVEQMLLQLKQENIIQLQNELNPNINQQFHQLNNQVSNNVNQQYQQQNIQQQQLNQQQHQQNNNIKEF